MTHKSHSSAQKCSNKLGKWKYDDLRKRYITKNILGEWNCWIQMGSLKNSLKKARISLYTWYISRNIYGKCKTEAPSEMGTGSISTSGNCVLDICRCTDELNLSVEEPLHRRYPPQSCHVWITKDGSLGDFWNLGHGAPKCQKCA
jgi:hypothetical protein